jgi:predicted signal transduction protein with EAL and GGDEF domain
VAIARRVEAGLRPGDTIARLGGDEFAILVDEVADEAGVIQVAERLQHALAAPFLIAGHEIFTSASIGIAVGTPHYDRGDKLLRDADTAMYRAKALGKARYEVFESTMHARAVSLLQLETDLRRALERGEIRVYYQPIVSLESGAITGFEALARWFHPTRGLILPDEFIPLAEETGLILGLGREVMRQSCRDMRFLQASGKPLSLSVNLSAKQLTQADLLDQIDGATAESGFDPRCLKIEITETVLMANAEAATQVLLRIKDRGIQIHVDDFGTGYSSLSYLQGFPWTL